MKAKKNTDIFKSTKWSLALIDLITFLGIFLVFAIFYNVSPTLGINQLLLHFAVAWVCIFICRLVFLTYKQIWRYGGVQSFIRLIFSDLFSAVLFYFVVQLNFLEKVSFYRILTVFTLNLVVSLFLRMFYRYAYKCGDSYTRRGRFLSFILKIFHRSSDSSDEDVEKIKIAIIGAGKTGVALAEEFQTGKKSIYRAVCFVDTDSNKYGRIVQGIPVISDKDVANGLLDKKYHVQEVVFAIPDLSIADKNELYSRYSSMGYNVKVYDFPKMQSIKSSGKIKIKEFGIEELLFRKSISVIDDGTKSYYKDKTILVSGGGGSIGSELCRQVASFSPKKLIVLDIYENSAYDLQQELKIKYGSTLDFCVEIVSITNRPALERVFIKYKPQIVINAAAHKHVPLMENNCIEAVENNVFGTLNMIEISEKYNVERFIMVSTDKAVNPTNVMGATKRMCEMIALSHANSGTKTTYSVTRFGNVLGSAGSVIPLFKRQIENGGPLTITDKRIIRYFMTIPEASQLVLQSGAMAKNGELFVLDMGKPVKIYDLANNMIRMSGLIPDKDIEIREIGLRPGEKLYEELLIKTENLAKTKNELIFIEKDEPLSSDAIEEKLKHLREAIEAGDEAGMKLALKDAVPTFKSPEEVNSSVKFNG